MAEEILLDNRSSASFDFIPDIAALGETPSEHQHQHRLRRFVHESFDNVKAVLSRKTRDQHPAHLAQHSRMSIRHLVSRTSPLRFDRPGKAVGRGSDPISEIPKAGRRAWLRSLSLLDLDVEPNDDEWTDHDIGEKSPNQRQRQQPTLLQRWGTYPFLGVPPVWRSVLGVPNLQSLLPSVQRHVLYSSLPPPPPSPLAEWYALLTDAFPDLSTQNAIAQLPRSYTHPKPYPFVAHLHGGLTGLVGEEVKSKKNERADEREVIKVHSIAEDGVNGDLEESLKPGVNEDGSKIVEEHHDAVIKGVNRVFEKILDVRAENGVHDVEMTIGRVGSEEGDESGAWEGDQPDWTPVEDASSDEGDDPFIDFDDGVITI